MIPSKHRLNLRKKQGFFNKSRRYFTKYFTVFYCFTSRDQASEMAVVVPKKNVKKRVLRSKIKRQIYAAALPLLREISGLELVVVVKNDYLRIAFNQMATQLNELFEKITENKI